MMAIGAGMVFLSIGIYTSEGTLTPNMRSKKYRFAKISGILGVALLLLVGAGALAGALQFDPGR